MCNQHFTYMHLSLLALYILSWPSVTICSASQHPTLNNSHDKYFNERRCKKKKSECNFPYVYLRLWWCTRTHNDFAFRDQFFSFCSFAKRNFKWIGNFVVISKTVIFLSTSHTQQWLFYLMGIFFTNNLYTAFKFS